MTQSDKDLLLKDLCVRLPYGVKIAMPGLWDSKITIEPLDEIFKGDDGLFRVNGNGHCIEYIKPYLFPMSNMTEEQKQEYTYIVNCISPDDTDNWKEGEFIYVEQFSQLMHFYLINHLDYMGLIPMGLAEDATGKNIY